MVANNVIPPRIHVLAKPSGATCNLGCSYCFFLDKELLYPNSKFRMSDVDLEAYIRQLIESHRSREVTVAWQGGEPTLMGVDFYRKAIEYQKKYRKPGMTFENTMQTNGTLLNDEWCEFLKENDFLVGISIDGPAHLHDVHRLDKGGKGTFDRVMRGLRLLQKHGVEYNILTTINRVNAAHPLEVYRFLRDEAKTSWIQFIPIVERITGDGSNLHQEGDKVTPRTVLAEQFGRFLIQIFDEWVLNDVGKVFVQTFEASLRSFMRYPTSGMCIFDETCGYGLALEHNGDLYSCDHFVEPEYLIGNIKDEHMLQMLASEKQQKFGLDKRDSLPKYCLDCEVRFACNGECPKNRFIDTPDGEPGLNYLCAGYKSFFKRVDEPMKVLGTLLRTGRQTEEIMKILKKDEPALQMAYRKARKTDPCPCGSGMTFNRCHGWKASKRGHRGGKPSAPQPRPPVRISIDENLDS